MGNFDAQVWQNWLGWADRIRADVQSLVVDRQMFGGLKDVVEANADYLDAHDRDRFIWFVRRWYVTHAAMGIRRHAKDKHSNESISLVRLLQEIKDSSKQVTLDFYLGQHPPKVSEPPWQERVFRRLSQDGQAVSEKVVEADISALSAKDSQMDDVVALVDKELAHFDKKPSNSPVYLTHLGSGIDLLDEVTCKYLHFLTGSAWQSLKRGNLGPSTDIFKIPWVEPKK